MNLLTVSNRDTAGGVAFGCLGGNDSTTGAPLFWTDASWTWTTTKPYLNESGGNGGDSTFGTGGIGGVLSTTKNGSDGGHAVGNCAGGGGAYGYALNNGAGHMGGRGGDGYVSIGPSTSKDAATATTFNLPDMEAYAPNGMHYYIKI